MLAGDDLKPIGSLLIGQIVEYVDVEREREGLVDDSMRQWYVLLIEPQQEAKAAAHLIGRGVKQYLPTIPSWTTRGIKRTKVKVLRPMFPGYLFVRLDFANDGRALRHIRSTVGVTKFLQFDTDYAVVPEQAMQRIFAVEQDMLKPRPKVRAYAVGEKVRINEGPFSGINGDIVGLDDNDRVKVLLSLLGRATPVQLSESVIEKL